MKGEDIALLALGAGMLIVGAQAAIDSVSRSMARRGVREGRRLLARGEHHGALEAFDGALALDRGCTGAHEGRARSLYALRRRREALAAARRAADEDPKSADACALVADILLSMGRWDEAARPLERAVRLDPARRLSHRTLCAILRERGRHAEACAAHERASRLFPDDEWLHYYRGVALEFLARGRPAESGSLRRRAIAAIRRAVEISPHHPEYGMALGHIEGKLREEGKPYAR
ncbi:MAG: tetratricopeptide repeat protein [Thaumarchaeota archaeon]|nr:tetratricopeptide repeat protein [Nitrososphaerota archaeon]